MTRMQTLGLLCSHIVDCEHKTSPIDEHGSHFAVGTPAMKANVIDYAAARRISEPTFKLWTRRLLPRTGDLLLAREAPVGPIVRIPEAGNVAPGQRTVLLRPDSAQVSSDYLYYRLTSPIEQARLSEKAAGSTVAHLNVADVRTFELANLPPLPEQRAIAEVLGALDDKIAANNRVASTTGKLADLLFAAASHRLAFSDVTFDELATISGGGTPSTKDQSYWGGEIQWATPTDVTGLHAPYLESTSRTITAAGLRACSSALHPVGSILMTSRATIGAFAVAQQPIAVNQGFIVVNANEPILQWWLFHEMRSRVPEFLSHANGATFLELSRGRFRNLAVRVADQQVMREFSTRVDMLHKRAHAAMVETSHLSATRDALLPLLMSGKVRVRDAEPQIEGAV